MKNKIMIAVVTVAVLGAGLFAASGAMAQTNQDPNSKLVQQIAEKFGLKQADVQIVFDQHRKEMQSQMQENYEDQLSQYVKDGKITEAQKTRILQKHKELQAEREAKKDTFQNMTPEQRKAEMGSKKQELKTWAKENNIDIQYLMVGHHKMRRPF